MELCGYYIYNFDDHDRDLIRGIQSRGFSGNKIVNRFDDMTRVLNELNSKVKHISECDQVLMKLLNIDENKDDGVMEKIEGHNYICFLKFINFINQFELYETIGSTTMSILNDKLNQLMCQIYNIRLNSMSDKLIMDKELIDKYKVELLLGNVNSCYKKMDCLLKSLPNNLPLLKLKELLI